MLHTPRLQLKLLTSELWAEFMANATDEEMVSTLALHTPELLALEKTKHKGGMTSHFVNFCIFLLIDKETGLTIGKAGYHNWQARHSRSEMGYGMEIEKYKRQGLMTEAVKAIIHYGFTEMGLYRIEACAGPTNTPSIRLLERVGFTKEGLLRQHYCKDGELRDSVMHSLLKPEYELIKTSW